MSDVIFRSQFTLPPITDLSIADTPNNRAFKTFSVRNLYTFYFTQCFMVSLRFLQSLLFHVLSSLMAFSGP